MAKVMICGSGAREHAMAIAYLKSDKVTEVLVTPGNKGMLLTPGIKIDPSSSLKNPRSFLMVAKKYQPDLIDVAQDDALAAGTVDLLQENGFRTFGPSKEAAKIEADKAWARRFMQKHGIACPAVGVFSKDQLAEAKSYALVRLQQCPIVFFKASGLYAGKGVVSATDENGVDEALWQIEEMGPVSHRFLVEDGVVGEEFSYYVMVDGANFVSFKSAQDNKRVWNRDLGPNTGGMGCNAPALVTQALEQRIEDEIIKPAVDGLNTDGIPYVGILYLGGIICEDGSIVVIEFNSRWGDPECHVILPGIMNDYFDLVSVAVDGKLDQAEVEEDDLMRVCIIGASAGYPGSYDKGKLLGIDEDGFPNGVHWLSAGIKVENDKMYTAGGRVFSIVAEARDVIQARQNALKAMTHCSITDNGLHYRTDIAWRDAERVLESLRI